MLGHQVLHRVLPTHYSCDMSISTTRVSVWEGWLAWAAVVEWRGQGCEVSVCVPFSCWSTVWHHR